MDAPPSQTVQTLWIAVTVLLGCTQALQAAMLGAMGRLRGPVEASWYSIFGTLTVISLVITLQAFSGSAVALPGFFANGFAIGLITLLAGAVLFFATPGIPAWFGITGLLAGPYLIAASWLAPRLGVGLFFGVIITGQLLGGLVLDHTGAFGTTPRPIDLARIVGALLLLAGVVLIRGRK